MEGSEISAELLKKLPQRLSLGPKNLSANTRLYYFLFVVITGLLVFGLLMHVFNFDWRIPLIILICILCTFHIIWVFLNGIFLEILSSKGFFPYIEFLPADQQIVIHDVHGILSRFQHEAEITIYLASIKDIQCEKTHDDFYRVEILTKKNERIPIISTNRKSLEDVEEFSRRLKAMIDFPSVKKVKNHRV